MDEKSRLDKEKDTQEPRIHFDETTSSPPPPTQPRRISTPRLVPEKRLFEEDDEDEENHIKSPNRRPHGPLAPTQTTRPRLMSPLQLDSVEEPDLLLEQEAEEDPSKDNVSSQPKSASRTHPPTPAAPPSTPIDQFSDDGHLVGCPTTPQILHNGGDSGSGIDIGVGDGRPLANATASAQASVELLSALSHASGSMAAAATTSANIAAAASSASSPATSPLTHQVHTPQSATAPRLLSLSLLRRRSTISSLSAAVHSSLASLAAAVPRTSSGSELGQNVPTVTGPGHQTMTTRLMHSSSADEQQISRRKRPWTFGDVEIEQARDTSQNYISNACGPTLTRRRMNVTADGTLVPSSRGDSIISTAGRVDGTAATAGHANSSVGEDLGFSAVWPWDLHRPLEVENKKDAKRVAGDDDNVDPCHEPEADDDGTLDDVEDPIENINSCLEQLQQQQEALKQEGQVLTATAERLKEEEQELLQKSETVRLQLEQTIDIGRLLSPSSSPKHQQEHRPLVSLQGRTIATVDGLHHVRERLQNVVPANLHGGLTRMDSTPGTLTTKHPSTHDRSSEQLKPQ